MLTRLAQRQPVLRAGSLSCVDLNEIQWAKVPSRGLALTTLEAVPNSVAGTPLGRFYPMGSDFHLGRERWFLSAYLYSSHLFK